MHLKFLSGKIVSIFRSLGTFRHTGNYFSEVPASPAFCISPGLASCPLRREFCCFLSPVWDSGRESCRPQRLVQEQSPNCSGDWLYFVQLIILDIGGSQALTQVIPGTWRSGYLKLLLLNLETFLLEISALMCRCSLVILTYQYLCFWFIGSECGWEPGL